MAQQTDIQHYDIYGGFAGFETPWLNLAQRGFHTQTATTVRPWLAVGFDYSEAAGHNSLTPNVLKTSLQQELGAEIGQLIQAGAILANYQLERSAACVFRNIRLGPQLEYRRLQARHVLCCGHRSVQSASA